MMNPFYEQMDSTINMLAENAARKRQNVMAQRRWETERQMEQARRDQERSDQLRAESVKNKLSVLGDWEKNEGLAPEFRNKAGETKLSVLMDPDTVLRMKPKYGGQAPLLPREVVDYWDDEPQIAERIRQGRLTEKQAKTLTDIYFDAQKSNIDAGKADAYSRNLSERTGLERRRVSAYEKNVQNQADYRNKPRTTGAGKDNEISSLIAAQNGLIAMRKQLQNQLTYKMDDAQKEAVQKQITDIDAKMKIVQDRLYSKSGMDFEPSDLSDLNAGMGEILRSLDELEEE
jgi:hypothetical protein